MSRMMQFLNWLNEASVVALLTYICQADEIILVCVMYSIVFLTTILVLGIGILLV